ncbi:MAG TPA: DUF5671 domain-containing protein [Longimicrobiales bacterium]|jgi:hypothetical protein
MGSHGIIRSIYLYVAAFVGLVLLTLGGVRLVDMALKATIFTAAEQELRLASPPVPPPTQIRRPALVELPEEEREAWQRWMEEQERWREQEARIDRVAAQRQRTAASSLAMIIVGLPLYLYHWRLIRRESGASRR